MKYILAISLIISSFVLRAQACNDDNHSVNVNDSWLSCQVATNPNPARGISHWVLYDLGYIYSIGTTNFWNYNVAGETDKGMKNVTIDYSQHGINWTEIANFQLNEASGTSSYTGESGPDFNEVDARFILITSTDTWGSTGCAGLSEVRFDLSGTVINEELVDKDKQILLFPNPTEDRLSIETELDIEEVILVNTTGKEILRFSFTATIDISFLPNGIFFLKCINKNNDVITKRFVKQE